MDASMQVTFLCNLRTNFGFQGPLRTSKFFKEFKDEWEACIIQQYGDWYTGHLWVGCYIWYIEEGPGQPGALHSPLLAVPNVTAHPSTASVPTSHHLMWHYNRVNALRNRFLCVSTLWMEHCRHITASVPVATDNVNKQQFDPMACNNTADKTDPQAVNLYTINLLLLLVCVSLTTIGQPRNSVFIRRV